MMTLADYRAHVARIAALPASSTDDEMTAICVDEANALDPASNVELRASIPDAEWSAWSDAMQEERREAIALQRRRRRHSAMLIAVPLIDAFEAAVRDPGPSLQAWSDAREQLLAGFLAALGGEP